MAILVDRSNAVFQPGTDTIPFSVDPAFTTITITLTHSDWPDGPCFRLDVTWDDATQTGTFECSGGVVRDKAGIPTGGTTKVSWTCFKPAGVAAGTARLEVLQRLRTAVLIEAL